jgi:hypothetical protein
VTTEETGDFAVDNGFRAEFVITYGSETYNRHIMFDVVRFFTDLNIGFDQLVALDGNMRGRHNDGDTTFAYLIDAVADIIRLDIESFLIDGDAMVDSMIIDTTRISVPARYRIISQIYENDKEFEEADRYRGYYTSTLKKVLGSTRFDKDQDGFEDDDVGGITQIVLHK